MKYPFTIVIIIACMLYTGNSYAQYTKIDSLFARADTTAVLDSLMNDFDHYLDSLFKPKSFFIFSVGAGTGFFSFKSNASFDFNTEKKIILSPSMAYFHKSGIGLSLSAYMMRQDKFNAYQYALSPSYDYIENKHFTTGVSYTRYFTKEDLSFYTTPIQNELNAYFNFKKWWIQPGVSLSYGWGSRTEYEKRELDINLRQLENARKKKRTYIYITSSESVKDFSTMFSLRHNFRWSKLLGKQDMLTLTPVVLVSGGTMNYGFNTSFSSNSKTVKNNFLPSNSNITDVSGFDVQSASLLMRLNYSAASFFITPQILLDYYLHSSDNRFNSVYSITAGVHF
ncbi:MAG: hypothetical protein WKF97_25565 [Chitinophagaceae bacterium]